MSEKKVLVSKSFVAAAERALSALRFAEKEIMSSQMDRRFVVRDVIRIEIENMEAFDSAKKGK